MLTDNDTEAVLLPHHEQQPLCTTRLPYRQGRRLTAVKVYTVNNESNHLLIFGVPSLNLRQETKALFAKFGKLLQFIITKDHPAEAFTETYHAVYERIQSARIAKKMLDTKNFYGGCLHVCYAPEFENLDDTKNKLMQRQRDVLSRLRNLQREAVVPKQTVETPEIVNKVPNVVKLNMGDINTIRIDNNIIIGKKRKQYDTDVVDKFQPCFESKRNKHNILNYKGKNISSNYTPEPIISEYEDNSIQTDDVIEKQYNDNINKGNKNVNNSKCNDDKIEIIDFTSTETDTLTNINDSLNYNKFGNEIVREIPVKPVNRIRFNFNNKNAN